MKTAHKTLKMEPELVRRISEWCEANDRSFNWFMAKAAELKLQGSNDAARQVIRAHKNGVVINGDNHGTVHLTRKGGGLLADSSESPDPLASGRLRKKG